MSDDFSSMLAGVSSLKEVVAETEDAATKPKVQVNTYTDDMGKIRAEIDMTLEEAKQIMAGAKNYAAVMEGFARQRMEQARRVRENPWANVAATIGGSLAAGDPSMPGWVQGLGRASLALNPRPEQLEREAAGYGVEALKAKESAIRPMETVVGLESAAANRMQALEIARQRTAEAARYHDAIVKDKALNAFATLKKANVRTAAPYETAAVRAGMSPEEAKPLAEKAAQEAQEVWDQKKTLDAARLEISKRHQEFQEKKGSWDMAMSKARVEIQKSHLLLAQEKATGQTPAQLQSQRTALLKLREQIAGRVLREADASLRAVQNVIPKVAGLATPELREQATVDVNLMSEKLGTSMSNYKEVAGGIVEQIDVAVAAIDQKLGLPQAPRPAPLASSHSTGSPSSINPNILSITRGR